MIRITVIIPAYNSLATIPATIASLLLDCHREYIQEIIVVDSSDAPASIEYLVAAEARGEIRLIRCASKTMPSLGRNIGANAALSPYLVFIDSDVVVTSPWSRCIVDFYSAGGQAGAGSVTIPPHQRKSLLPLGQLYLQFNEYLDTAPRRVKPFAPSCNLFCTRAVFDAVGGFPAIRASEDVLFCIKVSKLAELVFLPEARVCHVFRDLFVPFVKNQILLGKYVNIYRRSINPTAFYLNGFGALLSIPAITLVKFLRVVSRIAGSNNSHRKAFILSFPVFLYGLLCWAFGFIKGGFSDESV